MERMAWVGMVVAIGCGAPGAPAPAGPVPISTIPAAASSPVPSEPAYVHRCAADAPWLTRVGEPPSESRLMRFDAMRERGDFGPPGPVTTFNEMGRVERSTEERYYYPGPRPGDIPDHLLVLRDARGPIPSMYGPAQTLPSGVVEYQERPARRGYDTTMSVATLWVFSDGTWMRTEGQERVARIREAFAKPGTPPPRSTVDSAVAWEICGDLDANDVGLPFDVWPLRTQRTALRLYRRESIGRLFYDFGDIAAAKGEMEAQRKRCLAHGCAWVTKERQRGTTAVYDVTLRQTPTYKHTHLAIADKAKLLTAVPPLAEGAPPSGVYQHFSRVVTDTCPTAAAGKRFASMHSLYLLQHRRGRAYTRLLPASPRAGFIEVGRGEEAELAVGSTTKQVLTHLCPNYRMQTEVTVEALGANIIKSRTRRRYVGKTHGCRHPHLPSDCEHETVTTWVLRRTVCPAACDASYEGRWSTTSGEPPMRVDATCVCP
ncbi:MAG: hypothetical protein AAGA56_26810 [Myxococcota bacterium]